MMPFIVAIAILYLILARHEETLKNWTLQHDNDQTPPILMQPPDPYFSSRPYAKYPAKVKF